MRDLHFVVDEQKITKSENCDFSGIIKGTKGYLRARFAFGPAWKGCKKAAVFYKLGKEYPIPIKGDCCMIPDEALTYRSFSVYVVGEKEGLRITTNKIEIKQEE